jgi:hypothetical protein
MRSNTTHGLLGVVLAAAVAAAVGFTVHPQAQEIAEEDESKVSEEEIKLYIEIYGAMQADHDLPIERALSEHAQGVTLDQFRELERRIQREESLVERVRKALLEQAKARAASIGPMTGKAEQPAKEPPP